MNKKEQRCKALVVDDDACFATTLEQALACCGFCTHVAHTGKAGIEHFVMYRPYGVIVLDLRMPYVSGFYVLETIKQADADARVLALGAGEPDKHKAFDLGADAYLDRAANPRAISDLALEVAMAAQATPLATAQA